MDLTALQNPNSELVTHVLALRENTKQKKQESNCLQPGTKSEALPLPDDTNTVRLNKGSQADARLANRLETSGIPERYRDITFDEIERRGMPTESDWVDAFMKVHGYSHYLEKRIADGDGLILYGSNGNLKTSLAVAVLRQYIDSGGYGKFMPMCTLAHKLRAMWAIDAHEANEYHDKLAKTKLLVIDDLGAEDTQKDWVMTEIESILAERYNNRKSTIITTNLDKRQLVGTYSMRIMDRLRESAMCVEFRGKSLRKNLTISEELARYTPEDTQGEQMALMG